MQDGRALYHPLGLGFAQSRLRAYNVICKVPDLRAARTVIEELGWRAGIEADDISLTGPAAQEAGTQSQTAQADREMLSYWMGRTAPWGIAGTVLGFVSGILIVIILPIDASATNLLTAAFTLGVGIGIGAWLFAGMFFLQPAEAWELTFHETRQTTAFVTVHSERKDVVDLAERILRELGFTSVRRQDLVPA
jgi:hypothetical protein